MVANAEVTLDSADGDFWDKRWSPDYQSAVCHFKVHPDNIGVEGAPWLAFFHGGGGQSRDGRLPFVLNGAGNELFSGLLGKTGADDTKFNLISFTLPQLEFQTYDTVYTTTAGVKENGGFRRTDSTGNAHSQTATLRWNFMRSQERVGYPFLWTYTQLALCWWKSVCESYGCDPDKGIIAGSSFGGMRGVLSQYHPAMNTDELGLQARNLYGLKRGVDSTVRGVYTEYGPPDCRRGPQYVQDAGYGADIYVIPPAVIARFLGIFPIKSALDRVPNEVLEQMSYLWFAESPERIANNVPIYQRWDRGGVAGGGTNGATVYPVPQGVAHDESQLFQWMRTVRNSGMQGMSREILVDAGWATSSSTLYSGDITVGDAGFEGDTTATYQDVIQEDAYRWMRGCLGLAPRLSGKGPLWYSMRSASGGVHAVPLTGYASGSNNVDTPF